MDAGLSFFAFDWYYPEGEDKNSPLNNALHHYLRSDRKSELGFCLLVANHQPYRIFQKDWARVSDIWLSLCSDPDYLRVDGKPLFVIFNPYEFTSCMGGSTEVAEAFGQLQEAARQSGIGDVAFAACERPSSTPASRDRLQQRVEEGYTHFTGYNYRGGYLDTESQRIHPYQELIDDHQVIWDNFAEYSPLPYLPVVTCGWDKRAWEDPNRPETHTWYYPDRTPPQVAEHVRLAKQWIQDHPDKSSKDATMLLYAWNEYGEGGYIAPTKGDSGRYLQAISRILNE